MFLNNQDIIEMIKKESDNQFIDTVECRIKSESQYNIFIFTVVLQDQSELLSNWKEISSDIALHFQSGLEKDIEIWNIYILFLVLENVDSETRYLVEQNKYSSRKIVIEGVVRPLGEKEIEGIINDKLFSIQVDLSANISTPTEPVSKILETKFETLFKVINDYRDEGPSVLYTKYLEMLKNGI